MSDQTIATALSSAELKHFSKQFLVDFIFNSLNFELKRVSKEDVEAVLLKKESIEQVKEDFILTHFKGLIFVNDLILNKKDLTEETLKDLHEIIMGDAPFGGLYRNVDIAIQGSSHIPPSHLKVYDRMKKYFHTLESIKDPVEQVAYSQAQLAKIHPFLDGNGRTARLVTLYYLLLNDLSPIIFKVEDAKVYFNALEQFKVEKNIQPFVEYIKGLLT